MQQSEQRAGFSIVQVKAYGDLVIAVHSICRMVAADRNRFELVIGDHLQPLFDALNVSTSVSYRWLRHPDSGPAALFHMRARRLDEILASAWAIRSELRRLSGERTLVFDKLKSRERYLGWRLPSTALPPTGNIYESYQQLFLESGATVAPHPLASETGRTLRIFAGARAKVRQPPEVLLRDIVKLAGMRGWDVQVMLLEGERDDLLGSGLPLQVLPRDFRKMREAVEGACLIVSPDSMTAHIAEFCRKPVFVVTPVSNPYWLPLSAYQHGREGLFSKGAEQNALIDFLNCYE